MSSSQSPEELASAAPAESDNRNEKPTLTSPAADGDHPRWGQSSETLEKATREAVEELRRRTAAV